MTLYKVRNIATGKYLNRQKKAEFSIEGDFFKTFIVARNQRNRANPFISDLLEIVSFEVTEIGVVE